MFSLVLDYIVQSIMLETTTIHFFSNRSKPEAEICMPEGRDIVYMKFVKKVDPKCLTTNT